MLSYTYVASLFSLLLHDWDSALGKDVHSLNLIINIILNLHFCYFVLLKCYELIRPVLCGAQRTGLAKAPSKQTIVTQLYLQEEEASFRKMVVVYTIASKFQKDGCGLHSCKHVLENGCGLHNCEHVN